MSLTSYGIYRILSNVATGWAPNVIPVVQRRDLRFDGGSFEEFPTIAANADDRQIAPNCKDLDEPAP
jgi:hypothetical protein